MAGAWQDMPGYDRYIAAHDKSMACTYYYFLKCVFITFESSISCSLHVLCMLAYSNIRKVSPSMKTWWWHYSYVPVIYLHIPLYTVIWRYMRVYVGISGCQDSRWTQARASAPAWGGLRALANNGRNIRAVSHARARQVWWYLPTEFELLKLYKFWGSGLKYKLPLLSPFNFPYAVHETPSVLLFAVSVWFPNPCKFNLTGVVKIVGAAFFLLEALNYPMY